MNISSNTIKDYLLEKFSIYTETNAEFIVNSLFCEDTKQHMSINLDTGLWQCFKTKEKGNFVKLISVLENISYTEASVFLQKRLFDSPEKIFQTPKKVAKQAPIQGSSRILDELKNFKKLTALSKISKSIPEKLAYGFAVSRKIDPTKLYIATSGKYINRVIIPYEDDKGLFYFQARKLMGDGMKYLNPSFKEHGVKSSEIVYPFNNDENYVVVTEGPIDALSLQNIKINATSTQGSMFSKAQLDYIKDKVIILSYDNDEAGVEGMEKAYRLIRSKNLPEPYIVQPPEEFKDWNEFVVASNASTVKEYLSTSVKKMDYSYKLNELLK